MRNKHADVMDRATSSTLLRQRPWARYASRGATVIVHDVSDVLLVDPVSVSDQMCGCVFIH